MEKVTWHAVAIEDKHVFERYLNAIYKEGHECTFANFFTSRKNKKHLFTEYKGHLIVADTSVIEDWKVPRKRRRMLIKLGIPTDEVKKASHLLADVTQQSGQYRPE